MPPFAGNEAAPGRQPQKSGTAGAAWPVGVTMAPRRLAHEQQMTEPKPNISFQIPDGHPADSTFERSNVARAMLGESIVEFLPELEKSDLRVLLIHLLRFNGSPGSSYPSTASVARMAGLSDRSVRRARERLVGFGLLVLTKPAHGRDVGRYSVDECVRFSASYRLRREDSTPEQIAEDDLFTRPPMTGEAELAGHPRPATRPPMTGNPATHDRPKEQQKEQQKATRPPASLFDPTPAPPVVSAHGATAPKPLGFAEELGRSLCRSVALFATENQLDKMRAFVAKYDARHGALLRNQAFQETTAATANQFQAKADRKVGFLHAWIICATSALEAIEKKEASKAEKQKAAATKVRGDIISAILFSETEREHARERLAKETDEVNRAVWESTIEAATAEIARLNKELGQDCTPAIET